MYIAHVHASKCYLDDGPTHLGHHRSILHGHSLLPSNFAQRSTQIGPRITKRMDSTYAVVWLGGGENMEIDGLHEDRWGTPIGKILAKKKL